MIASHSGTNWLTFVLVVYFSGLLLWPLVQAEVAEDEIVWQETGISGFAASFEPSTAPKAS